MQCIKVRAGWLLCVLFFTATATRADIAPILYEKETLDNGLRVIYAPLHQAPVVHVRVLYHVGSRDERPDRQGFAHMFEHMMFRGSAHVAPEQHMKMIGVAGGNSNAFTSFDASRAAVASCLRSWLTRSVPVHLPLRPRTVFSPSSWCSSTAATTA